MSPAPIHYYMHPLASYSCLSINTPSNIDKHGSHCAPSIHIMLQIWETCAEVVELLTRTPWKTTLSTAAQGSCAAPFAVSLTDSGHFQSSLGQRFFLPPPSVWLFHTFLIQLYISSQSPSLSGSPNLLNDFFNCIH